MNTISTHSYREKYLLSTFNKNLRKAQVAEKVCAVDRTANRLIKNPYGNQPTATVQAIAGTYSVTAYTLTDDDLTVADEIVFAEHIFDWESLLTQFDVFASRIDEMSYAFAYAADKWALN